MKILTKHMLSEFGGNAVSKSELEKICRRFGVDCSKTVNFMLSYGYFIRILRGVYYVKTLEEFKFKKAIDTFRIISLGMNKLGINWYFGLYTALSLNGITHEYFDTIFILNDRIFRPKDININGRMVRFIKIKKTLFGFGVIGKKHLRYSNPEKTLLDIVYISRYRSVPEERIIANIEEYKKYVNVRKIKEYLKFYPKSVYRVMENAGFI